MLYISYYNFPGPVGRLGIGTEDEAVTHIFPACQCPIQQAIPFETALHQEAARQLDEFFTGKLKAFTLPISPKGTEFQRAVWSALAEIPWGETRSYGDIARRVGRPKGFQAVGQANSRNPVPFIIPCHRVIASDGSLGGYSLGLGLKQWLLELERHA